MHTSHPGPGKSARQGLSQIQFLKGKVIAGKMNLTRESHMQSIRLLPITNPVVQGRQLCSEGIWHLVKLVSYDYYLTGHTLYDCMCHTLS